MDYKQRCCSSAVTFSVSPFFSSCNTAGFQTWLCSQLITFYTSHFEWLDKVECVLDGACGFVTRGAYMFQDLAWLSTQQSNPASSSVFSIEQLLYSSDFRTISIFFLFFPFSLFSNLELEKMFHQCIYTHLTIIGWRMLGTLNPPLPRHIICRPKFEDRLKL